MASRRLALNLTQGLRSRAALNTVAPLKRSFATPVVKNGVKTESTTLSNGLTVRDAGIVFGKSLTVHRSLLSIRRGRKRRLLAYGSMLVLERKLMKRTVQRTSWNILLSRYASIERI